MTRGGWLVIALALGACADRDAQTAVLRADLAAAHPSGSPVAPLVAALRARGFDRGRPFGPPVDYEVCHIRAIHVGVTACGTRHVCHDADAEGRITRLMVDDFVWGL